MATPIPSAYKDAFIALIQVTNEYAALRCADLVNNYEDIPIGLGYVLNPIEANPAYLNELLNCFPDVRELNAVGIYYNQDNADIQNVTYSGINIFCNCNLSGGISVGFMDSPPASPPVTSVASIWLANTTSVTQGITVNSGFVLNILYMGSGSSVDVLDSSASGSAVATLTLMNVKTNPSSLSQIKTGSNIGRVEIQTGAIFGGIGFDAPDSSCAQPVTNLAVGNVTHNTVPLTWTNPSTYLFINIYYRKQQAPNWIPATDKDGDFVGQTGYTFRTLLPDTNYEFSVVVTCKNGGLSPREIVTAQTTSSPS